MSDQQKSNMESRGRRQRKPHVSMAMATAFISLLISFIYCLQVNNLTCAHMIISKIFYLSIQKRKGKVSACVRACMRMYFNIIVAKQNGQAGSASGEQR